MDLQLLIGIVVFVVVVGGASWYFFIRRDDPKVHTYGSRETDQNMNLAEAQTDVGRHGRIAGDV
ncbi:hypothetical protein [Agromyces rhizosphaerae]|nr:hypothetical protein [Agromyces rhizosphaerae]